AFHDWRWGARTPFGASCKWRADRERQTGSTEMADLLDDSGAFANTPIVPLHVSEKSSLSASTPWTTFHPYTHPARLDAHNTSDTRPWYFLNAAPRLRWP